MNKVLLGVIAGMLALSAAGWATASRSTKEAKSLSRRVALLERRDRFQFIVNNETTRRLSQLENRHVSVNVVRSFGSTDSNGGANATATCIFGKAVGGGGSFVGTSYYGDQINYSYPYLNGWAAAATGPTGAGRSFETYVVCAN